MIDPERVLKFDELLAEFQWLMDVGLRETAYTKIYDINELLIHRSSQIMVPK